MLIQYLLQFTVSTAPKEKPPDPSKMSKNKKKKLKKKMKKQQQLLEIQMRQINECDKAMDPEVKTNKTNPLKNMDF